MLHTRALAMLLERAGRASARITGSRQATCAPLTSSKPHCGMSLSHTVSTNIKEERHVMNHILSITSSTCALRYFYAGDDKWRQMSRWGLHMQVAQPAHGPTRPCQCGRIHVKYPRAIPHPWITLESSLKGGG